MPNWDPIAFAILGAMITLAIGLISKIIFSWLQARGTTSHYISPTLLCDQKHKIVDEQMISVESRLQRVDRCLAEEKIKTAGIIEMVSEHEKRLDRGSKDFRSVKDDIAEIRQNIAVLLERSIRTRESYAKGLIDD